MESTCSKMVLNAKKRVGKMEKDEAATGHYNGRVHLEVQKPQGDVVAHL